MKNLKNQKGITLVALVVTIIVLLILAGVSLSLVAGSNGIMTRTVNARDKNEAGAAAEAAELVIAELQMAWYEDYYANGETSVKLEAYFTNNASKLVTPAGDKIEIADGNVTVYKGTTTKKLAETTASFSADSLQLVMGRTWTLNPE